MNFWYFLITINLCVPTTIVKSRKLEVTFTQNRAMLKRCIKSNYNQREVPGVRVRNIEDVISPHISTLMASVFHGKTRTEEKINSETLTYINQMRNDLRLPRAVTTVMQAENFRYELRDIITKILLERCSGKINYK